jgi:hypothetical protein
VLSSRGEVQLAGSNGIAPRGSVKRGTQMYIGIGTLVAILIIVLIVLLLRRAL